MAVIITGPGEVTSPLRKAQHSSWSCRTRHVSNCPSATGTQKASSVTPTRSASQLHKQSQIKTAGSLWSHCNRCVASAPSCLFLRVFFFFYFILSLLSCLRGCRNTCGRTGPCRNPWLPFRWFETKSASSASPSANDSVFFCTHLLSI